MPRALTVWLLLLIGLCRPLNGEVFTLWPFTPGGGASGAQAGEFASGEPLLKERVLANGVEMELEVYACERDFEDIVLAMQSRVSPENFLLGSDSLRVAFAAPGGQVERWLFVPGDAGGRVTLFRSVVPQQLPPVREWPAALPGLPPGAVAASSYEFPDRGSVYGGFEYPPDDGASAEERFEALDRSLRAAGWRATGGSGGEMPGGTYWHPERRLMLAVGFNGAGGSFYQSSGEGSK